MIETIRLQIRFALLNCCFDLRIPGTVLFHFRPFLWRSKTKYITFDHPTLYVCRYVHANKNIDIIFLSCRIAARNLVLTVPIGIFANRAISSCV